jgi:hypothetical protein
MQKIELRRDLISNQATLGKLYLSGQVLCETLENPWLNNHSNISCIPTGKYLVKSYSSAKYPNVWELQGVRGRSKILIHIGNTTNNTEGCVLVGKTRGFLKNDIAVLSSRVALEQLREILDDEFELNITCYT